MNTPRKNVKLGELFTDEELKLARRIVAEHERTMSMVFEDDRPPKKAIPIPAAQEIADRVTRPAIDRINKVTGQENDPMYWAYALEYAITSTQR